MGSTPIAATDFLVLDMEMTGLDPDRDEIIELAAVPTSGLEMGTGDAFYSIVRPDRNIPAKTKEIHGMTGKELAEAPPLEEVLPYLLKMLHGRIVVGHNVAVDMEFLRHKSRRTGKMPPKRPMVDTARLGSALFPGRKTMSLDRLLAEFGMDRPRGKHDALSDTILTARLFLKMIHELKAAGRLSTAGDILKIGGTK